MLNQVVLVGRIFSINKYTSGNKNNDKKGGCSVEINVPRPFKNSEGIYETDRITCMLFGSVAENVSVYCKKGDIVGIRGRIETRCEGNVMEIIADKITFLSSKPTTDDKEANDGVIN